ncbi:hypothetical protein [Saccharopolyspora sp. CA-218241]|uniref:hypothetical protein n=1 Tax=Saccharopolyspora sp. CA-218241 TaxID=3240027 RepID=UPI003D95E23E
MKFRSASVVVLAAVPLALAGCAGGGEQAAPPPQQQPPQQQQQRPGPQAAAPEDVAWTGKLCGLVGGFTASQQQLPGVDRSSTGKFKQSVISQIDTAATNADETLRGIRELGPTPVAGAEKLGGSFEQGFVQARDILLSAKQKAEGVDASNQQAFQAGMGEVQAELAKGEKLQLAAEAHQFETNPELKAAAEQAPECAALVQPPPQQPPNRSNPRSNRRGDAERCEDHPTLAPRSGEATSSRRTRRTRPPSGKRRKPLPPCATLAACTAAGSQRSSREDALTLCTWLYMRKGARSEKAAEVPPPAPLSKVSRIPGIVKALVRVELLF